MNGFQEVEIYFEDEVLVVPSNKIFGLIKTLEKHITLADPVEISGNPDTTFLTEFYIDLLRYAGKKITEEEVFCSILGGSGGDDLGRSIGNVFAMIGEITTGSKPGKAQAKKKAVSRKVS